LSKAIRPDSEADTADEQVPVTNFEAAILTLEAWIKKIRASADLKNALNSAVGGLLLGSTSVSSIAAILLRN
jgi:hypothetical protein